MTDWTQYDHIVVQVAFPLSHELPYEIMAYNRNTGEQVKYQVTREDVIALYEATGVDYLAYRMMSGGFVVLILKGIELPAGIVDPANRYVKIPHPIFKFNLTGQLL